MKRDWSWIRFWDGDLFDAGASINTPNIESLALIIEELDWGGQKSIEHSENSLFRPHLGLGRPKKRGQTWANP